MDNNFTKSDYIGENIVLTDYNITNIEAGSKVHNINVINIGRTKFGIVVSDVYSTMLKVQWIGKKDISIINVSCLQKVCLKQQYITQCNDVTRSDIIQSTHYLFATRTYSYISYISYIPVHNYIKTGSIIEYECRIITDKYPVNTRVSRGPNWIWGDQDSNGFGTIIEPEKDGWVTVRWDSGYSGKYRMVEKCYDLIVYYYNYYIGTTAIPVDLSKYEIGTYVVYGSYITFIAIIVGPVLANGSMKIEIIASDMESVIGNIEVHSVFLLSSLPTGFDVGKNVKSESGRVGTIIEIHKDKRIKIDFPEDKTYSAVWWYPSSKNCYKLTGPVKDTITLFTKSGSITKAAK
jgi:hypothetical protein